MFEGSACLPSRGEERVASTPATERNVIYKISPTATDTVLSV